MSKTRPKPKQNTAQAVDSLREMIFSGALAAGTDHLEGELADRLGMSRTPIREALLVLQAQGLVEVRPRKGIRVCPLSSADMAEVYDVLTELESLSAARAAAAGHEEEELQPLADSIAAMEDALARDDRKAWAEADEQFHGELVRLGGNSRVAGIVAMMSDQVRHARNATLFDRPLPTRSNADHRAVFEAIAKGDAESARDIHRSHRKKARDMLVALLKQRETAPD